MTASTVLSISGIVLLIIGGIAIAIGANLYNEDTYESKKWAGISIKIGSMILFAALVSFVKAFLG